MKFFLEHGTMNKSYKEIFYKFFTAIEQLEQLLPLLEKCKGKRSKI